MRKPTWIRETIAAGGLLALAACLPCGPSAQAKSLLSVESAAREVSLAGSPYRYTTLSPGSPGKLTIVARTDRKGGKVSRWWYLPGEWFIPAVSYELLGGGLSANGGTLVLRRYSATFPPQSTRLAVLDTAVNLRHPHGPGEPHPLHAISRIALRGDYEFDAISPHGSTAYLRRHPPEERHQNVPARRFELRALDLETGRLSPTQVTNANAPGEQMRGVPISQASSADGRHSYTLYDGDQKVPFIQALDTTDGTAMRIDLPGLGTSHRPAGSGGIRNLFLLRLQVRDHGRRLAMLDQLPRKGGTLAWAPRKGRRTRVVMSLDTRRLTSAQPTATASSPRTSATPETAPASLRQSVAGHSAEGRPIMLLQLGDPGLAGRLLVFGCIHGDECAARRLEPLHNGCPDAGADIFVVPDLNPDGFAAGTRLNGRGVDLNRNFAAGWEPIGHPGNLQYSGPHPFSEPESRLAARLVRRLRPRVTVWFHQYHAPRPLVRAWGPSRAAARRFARLAKLPYRAIPWPAGTAPHWQNARFPGAAAFVVELPRGNLARAEESRLDRALDLFGREVGED